MGRILSQCIHILNHHDVHFKYLVLSFVKYTSIKLEKKNVLVHKRVWNVPRTCRRLMWLVNGFQIQFIDRTGNLLVNETQREQGEERPGSSPSL